MADSFSDLDRVGRDGVLTRERLLRNPARSHAGLHSYKQTIPGLLLSRLKASSPRLILPATVSETAMSVPRQGA